MTVRPRSGGYQADFTFKDQRYRAQFPTEQQALSWEADTRAALIAGRPLPSAPTGAMGEVPGAMSLEKLMEKTIERKWKGTKNELGASRNAQQAVSFFGANATVAEVFTPLKIDDYIGHLMKLGDSGSTINRKLAALSKMGRHAITLEQLKAMPQIERRPEGEARERFLLPKEADALIALLKHWGKEVEAQFVAFLLDTGARVGEALALRVRDVGEDRVTLGAVQQIGSSKTGWRVVPLTDRGVADLAALVRGLSDAEAVFGSRINRYTFAKLYAKAVDHLNLGDDVVIHTLRHTCASWLVQRGVDLRRVQVWMGHKSIQTTLRYAKLSPTSLFEAVDVLNNPPAIMRPKLKAVD